MKKEEFRIQCAIVEAVRWQYKDVLIYHVPNGGKRSIAEAVRFKKMGVVAGIPDLVCVLPDGRHIYLEVKGPGGKLSESQKDVLVDLDRRGIALGIVRSADEAIHVIGEELKKDGGLEKREMAAKLLNEILDEIEKEMK